MARTLAEINQEYSNTCAQLGQAQFEMSEALPEKINTLTKKISLLKAEAAALPAEQTPVKVETNGAERLPARANMANSSKKLSKRNKAHSPASA